MPIKINFNSGNCRCVW